MKLSVRRRGERAVRTIQVRLDDDLYEWLRAKSFYDRRSITRSSWRRWPASGALAFRTTGGVTATEGSEKGDGDATRANLGRLGFSGSNSGVMCLCDLRKGTRDDAPRWQHLVKSIYVANKRRCHVVGDARIQRTLSVAECGPRHPGSTCVNL